MSRCDLLQEKVESSAILGNRSALCGGSAQWGIPCFTWSQCNQDQSYCQGQDVLRKDSSECLKSAPQMCRGGEKGPGTRRLRAEVERLTHLTQGTRHLVLSPHHSAVWLWESHVTSLEPGFHNSNRENSILQAGGKSNWGKLFLLFSSYVMSGSFVTPWTIACQAPLSMDFPGKNTGMDCHFLPQGIFPTQGANPCLLQWQTDSLPLSHQGNPNWGK